MIATLSRDTAASHVAAERLDLEAMAKTANAEQAIKQEAFRTITVFTDDAYKTMFKKETEFYKVVCKIDPKDCLADPRKVSLEKIDDKAAKEVAMRDGKVLAVNGILNEADRAGQLAYQNAPLDRQLQKPTEIILMHIAPADTLLGELMVAGYEKELAPVLGYTIADHTYAGVLQGRGNLETLSLGHSRGTIVQYNAFNIAAEKGYTNEQLSVLGVGGAKPVDDYTNSALKITTDKFKDQITFVHMANDAISVIAAGNAGDALNALTEFVNIASKNNSAHSCYGTGAPGCVTIANPVPGGPSPTNQRSEDVKIYRGGVLLPQGVY